MMNETGCLIGTICERKKNWTEYMWSGEGMLKDVLERRMLGKKQPGRARTGMVDDLL